MALSDGVGGGRLGRWRSLGSERAKPEPKQAEPEQSAPEQPRPEFDAAADDSIQLAHRATEELRAAAALMTDAQRVANFGSWEWRVREDDVSWSEQLYRIFGLDPASFAATFEGYLAHVHPADQEHARTEITQAVEERRAYRFEHRIVRPGGEERVLRCHGEPIMDRATNEVVRVVGVCQDVTELVRTEHARDQADARFRSAFENAPIGIALVDFSEGPDGRLTEVNRALGELTGRSEKELVGWTLPALSLSEDAELDRALRERLVAGELDRFSIEKRALFEDRLVWLQLSVSALPGERGGAAHGIVQVQDVTERKRFEDQLRYIADHDSLTGLMNRRRFREELESQLALQQRYGGEAALLLVDVDRLKAINDSRGHGAGDMVLRRVAEVMRSRMRSTDAVARLAGDEFAVLLPNVATAQATLLGEELLARLAAEEVEGWNISVSIGVAPFGGEADEERSSPEEVTAAADAAMYRAKQRGGAVVEIAGRVGPDPGAAPEPLIGLASADPSASLAERVRAALEGGDLLLYAQPAIDLRTGAVAHREVLVRMRDASGAVLAASDFLAAAAQQPGLCAGIDRWVLGRTIAALRNGSHGTRLHINLSGETLADEGALERLTGDLTGVPDTAASLGLEIGEGSIRRDVEWATAAIHRLSATGCPLILDGFSAAFGSFEYLQNLPLDQVKIEGVVTKALLGDEPDHATIRAIVNLAQGTGKTTVAKLVESDSLLPILRMHGVDMAQGFELGEPAPLAA